MSFESTAEGQVGVDGADRWTDTHWDRRQRKPVFRTASEFLHCGCSGRSGSELPMSVGWA